MAKKAGAKGAAGKLDKAIDQARSEVERRIRQLAAARQVLTELEQRRLPKPATAPKAVPKPAAAKPTAAKPVAPKPAAAKPAAPKATTTKRVPSTSAAAKRTPARRPATSPRRESPPRATE